MRTQGLFSGGGALTSCYVIFVVTEMGALSVTGPGCRPTRNIDTCFAI
jgi:hypothetical protein